MDKRETPTEPPLRPLAAPSASAYVASDGLPVPPLDLIFLVVGVRDPVGFVEGGRTIAHQCIVNALKRHGLDLNQFDSILDFGCGCGRLTRQWKDLTRPQIHGTDYNSVLIEWCRKNLPFARFQVNHLFPPLSYPDQSFDFIFAGSVFTHLTEGLQFAWLNELRRVMKPSGVLMITLHGDHYSKDLPPELLAKYNSGKHVVVHAHQAGTNNCGAYHSATYIREKLSQGFTLMDHLPKGWDTQDMVLLRKP